MPDYSICATAPNQLYAKTRELFLTGGLDWTSGNWAIALLSDAYTVDLVNHDFLDDVTGILAQSSNLQNKTATNGFADSDGVTFTALDTSGTEITQLIIYQNTGVSSTSRLCLHVSDAFGFPVEGTGDDLILTPDASFGGWFRL